MFASCKPTQCLSSLRVKAKQTLNNGCNPFSSTETLSSPLFKSLSPSFSRHTPPPLIIKFRNRAQCFITCTTPEMINNPCLVTICHVCARQKEEPLNEMSKNGSTTVRHSPISSAPGALTLTLETLCSPVAKETPMQRVRRVVDV